MGGGHLVAMLMAADLIDELWLTVCPLIIGGKNAPTPCDGNGFSLNNAPRFTLISHQAIGDEMFLNYRRYRQKFRAKNFSLHPVLPIPIPLLPRYISVVIQ